MHPDNKNLLLWDLPGVGTEGFEKETYLDTIKVDTYDFFLILISTRFEVIDAWLGEQISLKKNAKFYYVRTKIESDVKNEITTR